MVTYGGDEVAALVLDIGTSSFRAGYAGDDCPKAIIPSSYGYVRSSTTDPDVSMTSPEDASSSQHTPKSKLYIGQSGPSLWRPGMEVANPIRDGIIEDFGPVPQLISHTIQDVLRCNPAEHPILVTEPPWNSAPNRERMAEIMFEQFQVPAFYIANTGVLNAFAAGKGSALVIDVGESTACVSPVIDGFVLRKGLSYSPLPRYVRSGTLQQLKSPNSRRSAIDLTPHQLISSKLPSEPNHPPRFFVREDRIAGTTESWRAWAEAREVDEWLQSVGAVAEQGWNDEILIQRPPKQYEFPNGFNGIFGIDRFAVGEQFFWHNQQALAATNLPPPKTLQRLIHEALAACDPEIRTQLLQNVVITGGGSLFTGLNDRVWSEMSRVGGTPPVKIHSPGNPIERRYGAWLGGSILGSLGTFHQLWISKAEWDEHGKSIVAQRCK